MEETKEGVESQEPRDEKLSPKWLKGLEFRGHKAIKVEKDGEKKTRYVPTEKPLKEKDILSWKDYGKEVVMVAADGQKHRVRK